MAARHHYLQQVRQGSEDVRWAHPQALTVLRWLICHIAQVQDGRQDREYPAPNTEHCWLQAKESLTCNTSYIISDVKN